MMIRNALLVLAAVAQPVLAHPDEQAAPAPVKAALAWGAEKAGRLKPNGQVRGYSPLGRMVEIEGLVTGVAGKLSLWRALEQIAPSDGRLDAAQIADLAGRAEDQLARLHELRNRAAPLAFAA